jgi:hypothetical protein
MFAIWTEHLDQNFKRDTLISSEVNELKAGMILVPCGDEPTYWKLHSVYDTLEEAKEAHQNPYFLTVEPL